MPEKKEQQAVDTRMFSDEQIAQVKAAIKANPALGRQLIDSAQAGNQDDLRFLMEAGIAIFSDGPTESVVRDMPKD